MTTPFFPHLVCSLLLSWQHSGRINPNSASQRSDGDMRGKTDKTSTHTGNDILIINNRGVYLRVNPSVCFDDVYLLLASELRLTTYNQTYTIINADLTV